MKDCDMKNRIILYKQHAQLSIQERCVKTICINSLKIAKNQHQNQFRKVSNKRYIWHPIQVARPFKHDYITWCSAILHDVIEDSNITFDALLNFLIQGKEYIFPAHLIIRCVDILTKPPSMSYAKYIERILNEDSKAAKEIKICDMMVNINDCPSEKFKKKYEVYYPILCQNYIQIYGEIEFEKLISNIKYQISKK
jgi:(p)ppGpp synthase/HD superfamily hydrolase